MKPPSPSPSKRARSSTPSAVPAATAPEVRAPPTVRAWSAWAPRPSTSRWAPAVCRPSSRRAGPAQEGHLLPGGDRPAGGLRRLAGCRSGRPVGGEVRPGGRGHRQGWRAVPHQLRAVPQLHRQGRRADARQVRAHPRGCRPQAHLRGHADRPAEHALLPRHHAVGAEQEGHHRLPGRGQRRRHRGPRRSLAGRPGPVSEGLFGWIFGLGACIAVAVWSPLAPQRPRSHE